MDRAILKQYERTFEKAGCLMNAEVSFLVILILATVVTILVDIWDKRRKA